MKPTLVIAPSLPIGVGKPGQVRLTEKFLSGMQSYADLWDGPLILLAEPDDALASSNLDDIWVDIKALPFEIVLARFDTAEARDTMRSAGVVLGGTDHRLREAASDCAKHGVPYVMVTELSLQTRFQIIDADNPPFWRRWRRRDWAKREQKFNEASALHAAGVQCNGTPAFETYRNLNANTLLFFDSRVGADMVASQQVLSERARAWGSGRPLRLAFSGRLAPIKGADHLIKVALALRELGLPFVMEIFGDGPLKDSMAREIDTHALGNEVQLKGVLDFSTELMPHMQSSVDLFVCCHLQGDPSCTYLETMACGVPIVGYDNEAFSGLLRICEAGRQVPTNDWRSLAKAIVELSQNPDEMRRLAEVGIKFANEHTFEREFSRRIDHMKALLK